MNENILQRRLAHAKRLDFSRKSLDHVWNEAMTIFYFKPYLFVHDRGLDLKLRADALGQALRIACFKQNYVASDFSRQGFGSPQSYQVAFIQNGEAVTAFRLFHQV